MRYEFDPRKLAANVAKHGVWFAEAEDFEWETAEIHVEARSGEVRLRATGLVGDRLYVIVFTLRISAIRLIGMRKANRREVRRYVEG